MSRGLGSGLAALLVAGVASALQVSAAVGAFLLGIAISGSIAKPCSRSGSDRKRSVRIALWHVMTSEIQQL